MRKLTLKMTVIPYKKIILSSSVALTEAREILIKKTERGDKSYIDLSKIDDFECIFKENAFKMSKGPSSLAIGKMSGIPVFEGKMSSDINGSTRIDVIVKLNRVGGCVLGVVFLFFLWAFKMIWMKSGFVQGLPVIGLIAVMYYSMLHGFNKTIRSFIDFFQTHLSTQLVSE